MNISLQTCTKKKPSFAIQCLRTLTHYRPFYSQKLKQRTPSKRLDEALRVLDIISPKTKVSSSGQTHLRLIQDFLQTDSNHLDVGQHFGNDFVCSNSTAGLSNVFDEMFDYDVENSNSIITHRDLHKESVLSNAVSLCGSARDIHGGAQYHCLAIRSGYVANVYVGSSLISLYSKCGEMVAAYKVFQELPVRNVVSWTAIIAAFAQEWQIEMCLELYRMMRNSTSKPNDFTFTSILSACTGSGALGQGRSAHCQSIQMGFDSYIQVANALVSMYCKCGSLEDSFYVFNNMHTKDIVSWNSMIAGYAQHGLAEQAIDLFEEMKKQKVKPDAIAFLSVLSSCRHAGLVEKGKGYLNSMVEHGVEPELDHYSCLVDLLGRAGLIEEAQDFIQKMPIYPNAVIWGSLLASSRLHGDVWVGIQAAESRLLLEPECAATHVQLANLYASVKFWDQAARVRKLMKDKGLKTNPGHSWIEIKNALYRFRAEDKSITRLAEILAVVDCLVDHMKSLGYEPEMQQEVVDAAP
ncbi:pentatricopeptide repeat-containing protein At2g37320 [Pistacia vera]|uniref:pentatricopeptide repeat-containing protein At2g37320 n=1 Tax=Pistacia vera TaxID=55513 RepID=UPI001263398F|nr:pentatricopeptide repeat-containing protein At2g37320 [Pistacia vera]